MRPGAAIPGILVAVLALDAGAQPPGKSKPREPAPRPPSSRKSPVLALGLSVGISGAGVVGAVIAANQHSPDPTPALLGAAVAYVGPSIGRWYGGGSAAIGLIGRAVGAGFLLAALNEDYPIDDCFEEVPGECDGHDRAVAERDRRVRTLVYVGGAFWIGSTLYDFIRAPLDAREHNREQGLAIAPTVVPGGAGLAVGGSF